MKVLNFGRSRWRFAPYNTVTSPLLLRKLTVNFALLSRGGELCKHLSAQVPYFVTKLIEGFSVTRMNVRGTRREGETFPI